MTTCSWCKTEITSNYATKFCGRSCSARYHNHDRKVLGWSRTDESKLKTSNTVRSKIYPHTKIKFCICETCKTTWVWSSLRKGSKRFCSSRCWTEDHSNKAKKRLPLSHDIEQARRQKISVTAKNNWKMGTYVNTQFNKTTPPGGYCKVKFCTICGKATRGNVTCSDLCRRLHFSNLAKSRNFPRRSQPSWMEQTFTDWLISKGIAQSRRGFLTEVQFRSSVSKRQGRIDFYFPSLKLAIELDGSHHRTRIELDQMRDDYLRSKGINVVRISHYDYKHKKRYDDVLNLLKPLIGSPARS